MRRFSSRSIRRAVEMGQTATMTTWGSMGGAYSVALSHRSMRVCIRSSTKILITHQANCVAETDRGLGRLGRELLDHTATVAPCNGDVADNWPLGVIPGLHGSRLATLVFEWKPNLAIRRTEAEGTAELTKPSGVGEATFDRFDCGRDFCYSSATETREALEAGGTDFEGRMTVRLVTQRVTRKSSD